MCKFKFNFDRLNVPNVGMVAPVHRNQVSTEFHISLLEKKVNGKTAITVIQYDYNAVSKFNNYRKTSNIRRTLVGNKIVDHSDVVGASPVGAAPTTSSFST